VSVKVFSPLPLLLLQQQQQQLFQDENDSQFTRSRTLFRLFIIPTKLKKYFLALLWENAMKNGKRAR